MPALEDYYRVLQVVPEADHEVIRAAYRALATKYHPDVPGGSTERMAALNAAWTVLRHPRTRSVYDGKRLATAGAENGRGPRDREATRDPEPMRRATGRRPDSSSVLDFGRYVDWSIKDLARHDPDYLEWLIRTPNGRRFRNEVEAALAARAPAAARAEPVKARRHRRF
ncbi:MAG TPA: DnaJ domain-containing protein [Candidatus Limnocylindrales bacterium]|jgi:curved DNA-binding protein CbpA|nr:DnaJ domain-containing protein [Candidatus Limnocylindrales bacterium]